MRPATTRELRELAETLARRQAPPVLLLGSAAARSARVSDALPGSPADSPHLMARLASLIASSGIRCVLATERESELEAQLVRLLPYHRVKVYLRGDVSDERIAERLERSGESLALVKLLGDRGVEVDAAQPGLSDALLSSLRARCQREGAVLLGVDPGESWLAPIVESAEVWLAATPEPVRAAVREAASIVHEIPAADAATEDFVDGLCCAVLGEPFVGYWQAAVDVGESAWQPALSVRERERVDAAVLRIDDWRSRARLGDAQVRDLIRRLLGLVREHFEAHLDPDDPGICLAFLVDPSAPGGSEIRRIIESDPALEELTRGMDRGWVEITSRVAPTREREAVAWKSDRVSKPLREYRAIVLIDSVSFTGRTLSLAQTFLAREQELPPDRFAAALLMAPAALRTALDARGGKWGELFVAEPYEGYEVTFPWGRTSATQPVLGHAKDGDDPFVPKHGFTFTPKPWGDQIEFADNEMCGVRLLTFDRGQQTSLHYHLLRDEVFVVLDDGIRFRVWDRYVELARNDSIRIPAGVPHALIAADRPCRVLEIARGHYDQGADIVRLQDVYHRLPDREGRHDGFK